jgi:2-isopropylmalate synthase
MQSDAHLKLESLQVQCGSVGPQKAVVSLAVDGVSHQAETTGNGPVDAIFKAIKQLAPHEGVTLQLYQVHAVTKGTDAQAEVSVRLADGARLFNGHGADPDTLVASAEAYIHALNYLLAARGISSQTPTSYSELQKSAI